MLYWGKLSRDPREHTRSIRISNPYLFVFSLVHLFQNLVTIHPWRCRLRSMQLFVCFSTGTLQGNKCSPTGLCRYHPTAQLHHGFPEDGRRWLGYSICIGELFDYSCSVELAGSYLGHVPCKFWKVCLGLKYLPQINYGGKLTCLGCSPRIGYHWFGVLVKWACSFCM